MNGFDKLPVKRRRISTPEERLARAQLAVTKATARVQKEAEKVKKARQREVKAAERMAARTLQVAKYEAIGGKRKRQLDTRRKIIAGALALEHILFDARYGQVLRALIDEYVTRDQDRLLFELPPLPDDDKRRANPRVY